MRKLSMVGEIMPLKRHQYRYRQLSCHRFQCYHVTALTACHHIICLPSAYRTAIWFLEVLLRLPLVVNLGFFRIFFIIHIRAIDWSRLITLEERRYIREKIKSAYQMKASSYEELLELSCAIEEEFVFASAPTRLDYFKSGNFELNFISRCSL